MNINYDEIITNANTRAEELKALQEYVVGADDKAAELLSHLLYFANLGNKVAALDGEGKTLMPQALNLQHLGQKCSDMYSVFTNGAAKHWQIMNIVESLK